VNNDRYGPRFTRFPASEAEGVNRAGAVKPMKNNDDLVMQFASKVIRYSSTVID
jgi:hypothetical protein